MPNRLARESSPYLRQHAENPVDWYPWGQEALDRARVEDRPILLSIGYAACHWCHVMAHESFEDPTIAAQMNRDFVCVKVDREERPDLDAIYMDAVQAMVGHGGWPLNVFLTPDCRPFFGGTYFPKTAQRGQTSFRQLLGAIAAAWRERRADVLADAGRVVAHIQAVARPAPATKADEGALTRAASALVSLADSRNGGFGAAPKFPSATSLEFLLAHDAIRPDPAARDVVLAALRKMADGGIHDQIGGGFHRYSVDERWRVPHFEKMLYDQALLASLYLHAFLVSGDERLRAVVEDTLGFVLRELTSPEGAFYSSLDADSEGGEGRFYTWTPAEVADVLGDSDAVFVHQALGITAAGDFEARSVPHLTAAAKRDETRLGAAREKLFGARERRPRPGLDDKVIVSWNGLTIRALAEAGAALDRPDYVTAARKAATIILNAARTSGRLTHVVRPVPRAGEAGAEATPLVGAFLDDHAALAAGLLALYEATFDREWLVAARSIADSAIAAFVDVGAGVAYDVAVDSESLIVRPRGVDDGPAPSGTALFAEVLLRLSSLRRDDGYADLASRLVESGFAEAPRYPLGHGQLLASADLLAAGPIEIAIVGDPRSSDTRDLARVVRTTFSPRVVVAAGVAEGEGGERVALLAGHRQEGNRATAWVCRDRACLPPIVEPEALQAALASRTS